MITFCVLVPAGGGWLTDSVVLSFVELSRPGTLLLSNGRVFTLICAPEPIAFPQALLNALLIEMVPGRIMREESLLCHLKKRFVITTTNSRHGFPVYPNILAVAILSAPDQAWVADFTSIRLRSAFVYLACILDAFSRRCVGWHLSKDMNTQTTSRALHQAIVERHPQPGLIHHSDRGVQYASNEYIARLQAIGAQISMSAVGNPYDNAKAESFFKTLKQEKVSLQEYHSFADAEQNLTTFIEKVSNEKRLHSSLGYVPPAEFEAASLPLVGS